MCNVVLMIQKDVKVALMCLFDYHVNSVVSRYQFEGNVNVFARYVINYFSSMRRILFLALCLHTDTTGHGNTCGITHVA